MSRHRFYLHRNNKRFLKICQTRFFIFDIQILEQIELSPQPWSGPHLMEAVKQREALRERVPRQKYEARLAEAIAELELQYWPK
jgi:hypothetical protein